MAKMSIRVILKSVTDFVIKCDKFKLTRGGLGQPQEYEINGISENKPIYLDAKQIAAIVRVQSDEVDETGKR